MSRKDKIMKFLKTNRKLCKDCKICDFANLKHKNCVVGICGCHLEMADLRKKVKSKNEN